MLNDPLKLAMLIILICLEVPAAILLVIWWKRACKEAQKARKTEKEKEEIK